MGTVLNPRHVINACRQRRGLRQGVVVNIEATTNSIAQAIQEAEQMAAVEVQSVFVGIAGGHIRGFNSLGQVSMRNREVTESDVARVIEQAKAVNIPLDRQIIHTLPLEYMIDGQGQIRYRNVGYEHGVEQILEAQLVSLIADKK